MKSWALGLVALGLVWGSVTLVEAHIMTPDFVREVNKESIATHEKELEQENELRKDEKLSQQLRTKKKELENAERLEEKAKQNMSEDKLKEMSRQKREAEKRAEMKTLLELKRLEKKFMLKSDSGFTTELKSANKLDKKSHLMMKRLNKDMKHKLKQDKSHHKHRLEKELKQTKSHKASKDKQLKKSSNSQDEKKKLLKSTTEKLRKKRSLDETVLKHAPEHMKLGRNVEEKRVLKKLRMRMKRAAEVDPFKTDTKAFLSMRPGGKLTKYSEEDHDYWSEEQEDYMKKDASELTPPMVWVPNSDYNEVEGIEGGGNEDEVTPDASSLDTNELVRDEEVIPVGDVTTNSILLPAPDVASNEIIPVTEADIPDYIPTSSAAAIEATSLPSSTPDVAANEIIPSTEAGLPDVIQTSSASSVLQAATQTSPVVIKPGLPVSEIPSTGSPSSEVPSTGRPSVDVVSSVPTSPPVPETSQAPTVPTMDLGEPMTDPTTSQSPSAELAAVASSSEEPSVSYEESSDLSESSLRIVTLAPEIPPSRSAPLLATFGPMETTTPATGASSTTLDESTESTSTPLPTTTEAGGPWPWENLGPREESLCGQARFGPGSRVDRSQRRTLKILDGKEALPGSFPWQVAILDKDRDMLCGGTLIAPRWVMTAAHCIRKKLFVRLSEHHIHDKDGHEIEQKVRRVYRHPDFNSSTIDNDIALLRLPALPPFPDSLSGVPRVGVTDRACLPADQEDFPPVGTRCLVMGWGKASTSHSYGTDVLMYTRLPIISRKACVRANRKVITENMFCAGHYKGGSDTCSGDSGGPLLCSSGDSPSQETWTMYGVTSFGDGCGNAGKMGVYAKVNNYLSWVAGIMRRY